MKVELEHREPEDFKPITLTLTIESHDELLELWHRTNISMNSLASSSLKAIEGAGLRLPVQHSTRALWEFLDSYARPGGLAKQLKSDFDKLRTDKAKAMMDYQCLVGDL